MCEGKALHIFYSVYTAAGRSEDETGVVVPQLISGALTCHETILYLILPHGDPLRNPLLHP